MRCPARILSTSSSPRVNLTPMIDVVFLLIIFFLVSGHLARREKRHPVDLANANTATTPAQDDAAIVITLDAQSRLFLGGDTLSLKQCVERLRRMITRRREQHVGNLPPASVRVRVDQTIRYQDLKPLLSELASLGFSDVAIAVLASDAPKPSRP